MLYGLVLRLRHLAYDKGWKKSQEASVQTICVGNITVGGTGKTPMTELIIKKLVENWKQPAVLSRGYKRKSKGFQIVKADGSAAMYGDEPLQIARKFPDITVAVDKDRIHGCQQLSGAGVIVLDDAFQYRRLRATLNIILVDYNRPTFKDRLLPWGRLRDLPSRMSKADIVVVTKCPAEVDEKEREQWRQNLKLKPEQQLFFTTIRYCAPQPVFPEADNRFTYAKRVILLSGIANDAPLRNYLSDTYIIHHRLAFGDHHRFSKSDIRRLMALVKENPTDLIITTEKDAQRLRDVSSMPLELRQRLFYIPIEAAFLTPEEDSQFFSNTSF